MPGATEVLDLVASKTWSALQTKQDINGLFRQVISAQATLLQLVAIASLSFCPGLFEVLQCPTPSSLSWFEALPTVLVGTWGIYCLVLKKHGWIPLLYIGSGTAEKEGVKARFGEYDRGVHLPKYIEMAPKDGYSIVHKGILVSCSIPSAANIPKIRILLVAIEAAFSFMFWTMKSRTKDYGCVDLCPWDRDRLEWHGLCSHNPLHEDVSDNFDLSAEQLEAIAAEVKEKNRVYQAEYGAAQRARSPERVRTLQRKKNKTFRPKQKQKDKDAKAAKKFHCAICNVSGRNAHDMKRHNATKRHLKEVAESSSRST
jgi:hypothetical protein